MTKNASGAAGRRLYLDAIEEALQRTTVGGAGPKQPRRRIQDCMIRQLKNVEKERRIVGRMLSKPDLIDPEALTSLTEASSKVTAQMVQLAQSIRLGAKEEREAMGGMSEAQLDEIWLAQLTRLATKIEPAQRRMLVSAWFGDDVAAVMFDRGAKAVT